MGNVKSSHNKHVESRSVEGVDFGNEERKYMQNKLRNLKGKYEEMANKMGTSSSMDQLLTSTDLP